MHLNNVGIHKQSLENNLFSLLFELCERVVLLLWIKHLHFGSCSCFYSAKLRKASRACYTGRGTSCQKVTVPALKIVQFCDWIMWHLICKRNISTTEKKESLISHYSFPKVQKSLLLQTYCIVLFIFPFGIWVFRVNSGHIFKLSSKAMRSRLFFFLSWSSSCSHMTLGAGSLRKTPNITRHIQITSSAKYWLAQI